MNILVTGTRQPFAVDEIRKLGLAGHRIIAADTFAASPGSHSRHVVRRHQIASPRFAPRRFIDDLSRVIREDAVDLFVPTFEETFYVGQHLEELAALTDVFASPLEKLDRLHNKARFAELSASLGLCTPATRTVTSRDGLRRAIDELPHHVARASYSRGGTQVLASDGPLRGRMEIDDCTPSIDNPWIVQERIEGEEICTFSVARQGHVTAHATYVHPVDLNPCGGIVFHSISPSETLPLAQAIVGATGFHGQLGLDIRRDGQGALVLLECNPRATIGVVMLEPRAFADALLGPSSERPHLAPAGQKRRLTLALLREMIVEPRRIRRELPHLASRHSRDVFIDPDDLSPGLWQLFTYGQITGYRRWAGGDRDRRTDLVNAYSYDLVWNGDPIP